MILFLLLQIFLFAIFGEGWYGREWKGQLMLCTEDLGVRSGVLSKPSHRKIRLTENSLSIIIINYHSIINLS
jgi:hypothetical protein